MITLLATARAARSIGRMMSALSRCVARAAAVRQRRRTCRTLSALDDRALHDIGLNRTMVASVATHGMHAARDAAPLAPMTDQDLDREARTASFPAQPRKETRQ